MDSGLHPDGLTGGEWAPSPSQVRELTFSLLAALDQCHSIDDAAAAAHDYATNIGFMGACCIKLPDVGEEPANCILIWTLPDAWRQRYLECGHLPNDPQLLELKNSYRPYSWTELRNRRKLSSPEELVFQDAATFSLLDGYCVPIIEASGYSGIVGLAGLRMPVAQECRLIVALACIALHNKFSQLLRQRDNAAFDLTERELECLRWAAVGKSDWEIGQILTISAKTVNYHIENTKRKFAVATRVQAIVAALRSGKLTA